MKTVSTKMCTAMTSPVCTPTNVVIIVDAFRAFATASYVLEKYPNNYYMSTTSSALSKLSHDFLNPFFIGKQEKGADPILYDIPNSPTRASTVNLFERHVFHRTAAGAKGLLESKINDLVLGAAFTNADATARIIRSLPEDTVTYKPMGHEGITPSLEDDLCVKYIQGLLEGPKIDLNDHLSDLKDGPAKYFFTENQWEYPEEDFDRCLELRHVDFAIEAIVHDHHAQLIKKS